PARPWSATPPFRIRAETRGRFARWRPWPKTTASCRGTSPATPTRAGGAPRGARPADPRAWVARRPRAPRSPPEDVALAPRIGSAAQRAGRRIHADGDDARAHGVGAEDLQPVSARGELVADARRHAILDLEDARFARMIVERAERMQRVDP